MNMENAKLTQQGKAVEEDPQPGKYYRLEVPEGTDVKAAALELKKKFPKSFFCFRSERAKPEGSSAVGPAKADQTSEQKPAKVAK